MPCISSVPTHVHVHSYKPQVAHTTHNIDTLRHVELQLMPGVVTPSTLSTWKAELANVFGENGALEVSDASPHYVSIKISGRSNIHAITDDLETWLTKKSEVAFVEERPVFLYVNKYSKGW